MALTTISSERLSTNVKTSNLGTELKKKVGQAKNLIINGAMQVAQRGTSSTAVGYQTVDRMYGGYANTDEAPTFTQADIGSTDAPYLLGFRKSFKIQNGNQTSGAGATDEVFLTYNIEAQDLAQSGWDYTSSSSNITLSFWVKSSVAQQFQVNMRLYPASGDQKELCFEYTPSANTWTKVTKTIPGAAGNVLRNTNELGMFIQFPQFYGTDFTANSRPFDTWETKNNNQNYKDYATTWYTTDNATWEITGLQLEVGSVATDFEHKSFAQDLALCQRYYQQLGGNTTQELLMHGTFNGAGTVTGFYEAPVEFRTRPTFSISNVSHVNCYGFNAVDAGSPTSMTLINAMTDKHWIYIDSALSSNVGTGGLTAMVRANSTNDCRFQLSAEI